MSGGALGTPLPSRSPRINCMSHSQSSQGRPSAKVHQAAPEKLLLLTTPLRAAMIETKLVGMMAMLRAVVMAMLRAVAMSALDCREAARAVGMAEGVMVAAMEEEMVVAMGEAAREAGMAEGVMVAAATARAAKVAEAVATKAVARAAAAAAAMDMEAVATDGVARAVQMVARAVQMVAGRRVVHCP